MADRLAQIREQVAAAAEGKPIVLAEHRPTAVRSVHGPSAPVATLADRSVAAFCGIGNPAAFWNTLTGVGCRIIGTRAFPDHHAYSASDLAQLAAWARELRAEFLVTTQKDLVKIPQCEMGACPLVALQIDVLVHDTTGELDRALGRIRLLRDTDRRAA
jgi:tetraacyldisaccharide 4'-kinase